MRLINILAFAGVLSFAGILIWIEVDVYLGCKICGIYVLKFTGFAYTAMAFLFFIFGLLILARMKKYFRDFYDENKWIIFLATMGLCFSCLIRGIIDLLRFYDLSFQQHIYDKEEIYNFVLFFLCDSIPMCF